MSANPRQAALAICEALGLNPTATARIRITAGRDGVRVHAVQHLRDERLQALLPVLRRYDLLEKGESVHEGESQPRPALGLSEKKETLV